MIKDTKLANLVWLAFSGINVALVGVLALMEGPLSKSVMIVTIIATAINPVVRYLTSQSFTPDTSIQLTPEIQAKIEQLHKALGLPMPADVGGQTNQASNSVNPSTKDPVGSGVVEVKKP